MFSWRKPPKAHTSTDPFYVDFRFNILQIANVDTVAGIADVKVSYARSLSSKRKFNCYKAHARLVARPGGGDMST